MPWLGSRFWGGLGRGRPWGRAGGIAETELAADPTTASLAGANVQALAYEGSVPGPTLRLREGERVRLRFVNRLEEPTNLHLHGLHVSPEADAPFLHLQPGEDHVYEFDVPEGSAGTYWYHPHPHGSVEGQLGAGLAGALIVEGPFDSLPGIAEAEERLLVLKDSPAFRGDPVLVNGANQPILQAKAASLRLRLLNASTGRYFRLALEGHPLYLIATDGGLIEEPVRLEELLLAPGERAEVLVCFEREGNFRLMGLPYDAGDGPTSGPGEPLLTVAAPSRTEPGPLPSCLAEVPALDLSRASAIQRVTFEAGVFSGKQIDGKSFEMGRVDLHAEKGTLEVWEIENLDNKAHPFHIHSYPFQVLSRDGVPEPFRAWRDVVNLPPGKVVRIAIPFSDFAGKTVFHCHLAGHEDSGMMAVLEVTEPEGEAPAADPEPAGHHDHH
ncbi:MAG: multicopper oxidase family protein [Rubrobacteraceae bacterium]|nr:multicopper oxidase family protein [Rubrobacteraceae bacterium]